MEKKYIFNSSMPRSGSELIQVILHQNPEIYGSATSPLLEYWFGARVNQELPEVKSQNPDLMRKAFLGFCKGGLDGYYSNITDRPIVCDKSRGWLFYYNWLSEVLDEPPKIICMIRDLRETVSSMEKVWRNNRHLPIGPDDPNNMDNITVEGRVNYWLNSKPIGLALQRLYDADNQGFLDDIHIVKYEDLCNSPNETMKGIYDYLELDFFNHDFNNIEKSVEEKSELFGPYGNHDVKSSLKPIKKCYKDILGPELSEKIRLSNPWYYNKFYS